MTFAIPEPVPTVPPWDAANFQVSKWGARYYSDQLPPCDFIADPHVDAVPGFSSVKPSKPFRKSVTIGDRKYTVPLDWHRAGEWFGSPDSDRLAGTGEPWWTAFYSAVNTQRDRDFARGHAIHRVAEAFLMGGRTDAETNADAQPYLPPLLAWLEENVTDVFALEAVCFGVGYAGTGDAWLGVRGVRTYVDWKSRGADSAHGIYEEEVAQGGAYTSARYCILPTSDRTAAMRAPVPDAEHGLVLSIRPDGVQEFWYDLGKAREAWGEMFDAHRKVSDFGKLARAAKLKTAPVARGDGMDKPKPRRIEPLSTPTTPTPPDEGPEATEEVVAPFRERYTASGAKAWIGELEREALQAQCSFHLSGAKTLRRLRIMDGLVTLWQADAADEDLVKALVRHVTDDDAMSWPTVTAGAAVGSLSAVQAAAFVSMCDAFVAGTYVLVAELTGPRLAVAA